MIYEKIVSFRSYLLVQLTHNFALPFLQYVRKPEIFPYSIQELKQLAEGTLGNTLFHFLRERNLQLLPNYTRHDVKHILLGYNTTDEGEVCLQCFMLGNKHISFPVLATIIFGLVTMPEHWRKFIEAYKRGSRVAPIANWQWFTLMDIPVAELRERIDG